MPKRPSFQFYPSDWLRDTALRSCSTGARGLWIDMICYMHEGNPYGHLKVGDKVILPINLARMVGETLEVVESWLQELKHAGVYDLTSDGVIISRRMIRDENLRKIRAAGGKLGGNPNLMQPKEDNPKVNHEDKQKPTPSSSSSSSIINDKSFINKKENEIDWFHPIAEFVNFNCPSVKKLKKQLTLEQCVELDEMFGFDKTTEILSAMENFKSLGAKYVSVHLTALNWLKRAKNDKSNNNNNKGNGKPDFTDALREF